MMPDVTLVAERAEAATAKAVAEAIAKERARCADIADLYVSQARPLGDEDAGECPVTAYFEGQKIVASNIGHDIRNGL